MVYKRHEFSIAICLYCTKENSLTPFTKQLRKPIIFITVPSEPTNVVITNLTSTDFIVNWEEPLKVPGILQGYGISVIPTAALHYIPEDCETDLYPYYESTEAGTTDFYVDSLLPHYNYSVSVNASTRVGTGQQNTIAVYTLNGGKYEHLKVAHHVCCGFD